jgi:hypothetical protein
LIPPVPGGIIEILARGISVSFQKSIRRRKSHGKQDPVGKRLEGGYPPGTSPKQAHFTLFSQPELNRLPTDGYSYVSQSYGS